MATVAQEQQLKTFRLKSGRHWQDDCDERNGGQPYRKGQVFQSTKDLDKETNGHLRYERIFNTSELPAPAAKPQETPAEVEGPEGLGTDVTGDFPTAQSLGLLVFRDGRGPKASYYVSDPDEPGRALNKKALKRAEVESYLDDNA